jgi:hypothetical protein
VRRPAPAELTEEEQTRVFSDVLKEQPTGLLPKATLAEVKKGKA